MSKVFTITEGLENMGAIKTGGQGSVYKGRRVGEIITAIKLLPTPIFTQNEEDKHYRDFTNEVKKLQRVNEDPNPNVVKILSFGVSETGAFPFIEMEYIDGPDLSELLKSPHPAVFSIRDVIKVADHLSNALAHCHSKEVKHGDIKSNNVKYNQYSGNYILLDFGLAILSDEERRTSLRRAGAIEFMAPEQNEGKMLFETDVYSFGIILYELLAGKVPFPLDGNSETARNKVMVAHMETSPPDVMNFRAAALPIEWSDERKQKEMQVPEWLIATIYKCLEKRPADRFKNGVDLHEHIAHHRTYTTEGAGTSQQSDQKWQSLLAEKDAELNRLQSLVANQRSETGLLPVATGRTVSRSAFMALVAALVVVSGLAIYSLFFNKAVVGAANTSTQAYLNDSLDSAANENGLQESLQSQSSNKKLTKEERKKLLADSLATLKSGNANNENGEATNNTDTTQTKGDDEVANDGSTTNEEEASSAKYKVRNKAFFHDSPDEESKRDAFIIHWNNAVLKPLDEKNGFIYVVFTNHLGQTSKGWLSKADLTQVK